MITAKQFLFTLVFLTFTFAQNVISLTHEQGDDWSVDFNSEVAIGGFQFTVDGATINNSMGGAAVDNGFMVSASNNTVLGFSLTGSTIPSGSGVLLNITLSGEPLSLSGIVFSDANGSAIDFEYVENTQSDAYYSVNLEITGNNQLTILSNSITTLEAGDQIGVFDGDGITNYNDCTNQIGEILVGAGVWNGTQLNLVSIGSSDLCAFGGTQLSGFVSGNPVMLKIWRESEQMEYTTELTWGTGSGDFGDIIQSVSEIVLTDPNACADDDSAVAAFGGCAGALAALGCDFVFGGVPVSESCPETCDACPGEGIFGCMDSSACNYNAFATVDDNSCSFSEENFDCDGNCVVDIDCADDCNGSAIEDECGTCDADVSNDCIQDCAGDWGGTLVNDECGVCSGDNTSCTDCAGVPNGDAFIDGCENCVPEGDETCEYDCAGVPNGDAIVDECGVCEGTGIPDEACDCEGNIPLEYCYDADGDGTGAGNPFTSCFAPVGWVNDCSDIDPECATNNTDECGVCDGENTCFGCIDPAALNYSEDAYIDDNSCEFAPNYPFWFVNVPDYQYSGSITSAVIIDDIMVGNERDMVATFVNNELRGLENGLYFAPTGNYIFNVLAYSNVTAGEILSFKYYDAINDMIVELDESLEFISDMIVGNAVDPFILTPQIDEVTTNIQLVSGWNWFSVNVVGDDMSLNAVLATVDGNLNYIKSQTSYSEYYDSYGWWGTLETINSADMYKTTANNESVIEFSAAPVHPADVQIELSAGWNWVGYTPQEGMGINEALNSINGVASYIKNQTSYSEYYDSYGWWGTLENMNPYSGYMISTNSEGTLVYPDNMLAAYNDQSNIRFDLLEKIIGLEKVDASIFEFNGSVTVSVSDALNLLLTEGDILYAYVDGDLRGNVLAVKSPYSKEYLFPIMLYSNIDAGEFVKFKLLTTDGEFIKFNEGVEFNNDMIVGSALTPFSLSSINYGITSKFEVSHAYPNPFNPSTEIQFTIPVEMDVNVDIVNMQGRLIETLLDNHLSDGYHKITWNATDHASGVYFVRLNIGGEISVQKLMLMK